MILISGVIQAEIHNNTNTSTEDTNLSCQIETDAQCSASDAIPCTSYNLTEDNIHMFVVPATDGLIDYLSLDDMAYQIAQALYEDNWHVLTAAESLLKQASSKWHEVFEGQYRDDMAIAISQVS